MTDTDDDFGVVRGSGNVFVDLGMPNPEQRQLRAILAASIIKTLDAEKLTVRAAEEPPPISRASATSSWDASPSTG